MVTYIGTDNVWKSTHDEVVASRAIKPVRRNKRKGGAYMTEYEILMAVLTAVGIVAEVGSLIIALLSFFRKNQEKQK